MLEDDTDADEDGEMRQQLRLDDESKDESSYCDDDDDGWADDGCCPGQALAQSGGLLPG